MVDRGKIETSGHFWLPGKPGDTTAGTLLIDSDGSAELKLSDIVSGDLEHHASRLVQFETLTPPTRILGSASGVGHVTLEHCFANPMMFLHEFSQRPQPTDYKIGHVLCGALWETNVAVEFDKLFFSIEGLNEWVGESGFTFQHVTGSPGYSIDFSPPPAIELGSWNDLEISIRYIWQGPRTGTGIFNVAASQQAQFRLDSKSPRSFAELFEAASRLRDFVSLGVGRNLLFTGMTGYLKKMCTCFDGTQIKVHFRDARERDDERVPHRSEMLFGLEAIRQMDSSRLTDWLESYNFHHEPMGQYFEVFERTSVTWAQRFRSVFQVAETLFEQGMANRVEMKLPRAEVLRIVEKINSSFADEPDVAENLSDTFRNSNRLSARKKLERVLSENLGIRLDADVIRAASDSIVTTRDELTHVAGVDTVDFYMNHHASIKIEVLDAIIRIWMLRMAGVALEDALSLIRQHPQLRHRVVGLIESKDQSIEDMSEKVWWKRPL